MGVSRFPVMAALSDLRKAGFIIATTQGGCEVISPSGAQLHDFLLLFGRMEGIMMVPLCSATAGQSAKSNSPIAEPVRYFGVTLKETEALGGLAFFITGPLGSRVVFADRIAASSNNSRKVGCKIQPADPVTFHQKGPAPRQKKRFVTSKILNATAAIVTLSLGLAVMGCLPRPHARRLGHVILRKFPNLGQ